jgi:hypothetical protein
MRETLAILKATAFGDQKIVEIGWGLILPNSLHFRDKLPQVPRYSSPPHIATPELIVEKRRYE